MIQAWRNILTVRGWCGIFLFLIFIQHRKTLRSNLYQGRVHSNIAFNSLLCHLLCLGFWGSIPIGYSLGLGVWVITRDLWFWVLEYRSSFRVSSLSGSASDSPFTIFIVVNGIFHTCFEHATSQPYIHDKPILVDNDTLSVLHDYSHLSLPFFSS